MACHVMGPDTPAQPGNVGPDLSTIGLARSDEWLFGYVYDARNFNPPTVMPPWGAHNLFNLEEIKDIVAFLKTLKQPKVFTSKEDDPGSRTLPVSKTNNLDPTENPSAFDLDRGQALFRKTGANGDSCATCHAAPETKFKTWAATMPRYEPRLKKVLGVEEFITRHARATTGDDYRMGTAENIGLAVYLRNLANGAAIQVDDQNPGALAAAERGRALMARKIGQLNFSCTDCHVAGAGKWIRGQYLSSFKGTYAHFPTFRVSRGDTWDVRKRFQWCNVAIRANDLPPDAPEYGDLELALALLNQGAKINAPGLRN